MYFFYFLFFLTVKLKHVIGQDDYSVVSSWITDGHPILRRITNEGEDGVSSEDYSVQPPPPDGYWVADLRSDIKSTINKYGYTEAKPHIEKLVEDAEKDHNVLLQIKELNENGDLTRRHRNGQGDDDIRFRIDRSEAALRKIASETEQLRQRIFFLVDSLGYDTAKPYLLTAIQEAKEHLRIPLRVKVTRTGRSKIFYDPKEKMSRTVESTAPPEDKDIQTTHAKPEHDTKNSVNGDVKTFHTQPLMAPFVGEMRNTAVSDNNDPNKPLEPDWVESFKGFVKNLFNKVSKEQLASHLNSGALENTYGINLDDLNLNFLGDISDKKYQKVSRKVYDKDLLQNFDDNNWKNDFKGYVKSLVTVLSKKKVHDRLAPVVKSLEKSHNVIIKDVDGEVYLDIQNVDSGHKKKKKRRFEEKKRKSFARAGRKDKKKPREDDVDVESVDDDSGHKKKKKSRSGEKKRKSVARAGHKHKNKLKEDDDDVDNVDSGHKKKKKKSRSGEKKRKSFDKAEHKIKNKPSRKKKSQRNKKVKSSSSDWDTRKFYLRLGKSKTPDDTENQEWIGDFKLYVMFMAHKHPELYNNHEYSAGISNAIDYYQRKYGVEIKNFRQYVGDQAPSFDVVFPDKIKIPYSAEDIHTQFTTTTVVPNRAPERPFLDDSYLHDQSELDTNYVNQPEVNISVFYDDVMQMMNPNRPLMPQPQ